MTPFRTKESKPILVKENLPTMKTVFMPKREILIDFTKEQRGKNPVGCEKVETHCQPILDNRVSTIDNVSLL